MQCRHEDSMWGRCTACGMTWAEQARRREAQPVSIIRSIEQERFSYGDPVDVILRAAVGYGGHWLHRVVYDNGRCEYIQDRDLNQCSAGVGGDPASGCDTFVNPYATDGLCSRHRAAAAASEVAR